MVAWTRLALMAAWRRGEKVTRDQAPNHTCCSVSAWQTRQDHPRALKARPPVWT